MDFAKLVILLLSLVYTLINFNEANYFTDSLDEPLNVKHAIFERELPRSIFSVLKDQPKSDENDFTSEIDFAKDVPDEKIAEKTKNLEGLSGTLSRHEIAPKRQTKVILVTSSTSEPLSHSDRDFDGLPVEFVVGDVLKANNNDSRNEYEYVDDDYELSDDEDGDDGADIDGLYVCPRRICNFRGRCFSNRVGDQIFCSCHSGFIGMHCETNTNGIIIWLLAAIVCLLLIAMALIIVFKCVGNSNRSRNASKTFRHFQQTPTEESQLS